MANRWDVMSARPKKDGSTWWTKVGSAFQGNKGINVIFDSLPLPDAEGRVSVSLFEPRQNDSRERQPQQRQQTRGGYDETLDDDVPF